jgi:hypothetical protein
LVALVLVSLVLVSLVLVSLVLVSLVLVSLVLVSLRPATQADGSTSARTRSSKTGRPADTASRCGRAGLPVAWSVVLR